MNNIKFPPGIWEKASEIYNDKYRTEAELKNNKMITPKLIRARHYSNVFLGVEKAIEEAIEEITKVKQILLTELDEEDVVIFQFSNKSLPLRITTFIGKVTMYSPKVLVCIPYFNTRNRQSYQRICTIKSSEHFNPEYTWKWIKFVDSNNDTVEMRFRTVIENIHHVIEMDYWS